MEKSKNKMTPYDAIKELEDLRVEWEFSLAQQEALTLAIEVLTEKELEMI